MPDHRDPPPHPQTAIGNYIAQAAEGSTATVNVYEQVLPRPLDQATVDAALALLAGLPLDDLPAVRDPIQESRLPPFVRNPFFVGRHDDLRAIAGMLKARERATVVVSGMPGQGKTQLVNEFVYRYGHYFAGGVFWLNFADPIGIPNEIAACATALQRELRLDVRTLPLEEQVSQVLSAWQNALPRLLIFDNCEEEALLVQWRPPRGGCRLLVTSRSAAWSKDAHVQLHPLGDLQRAESIDLLGKYREDLSTDDRDAIAQELGDLPLALNLAGNYLDEYRNSRLGTAQAYLEALRRTTPLLHLSMQGEGANYPTRHLCSVERTFTLSYERIDTANLADSAAIALLACAAHFAPGVPFPGDLLRATTRSGEDDQLEMAVVQGLKRLTGLGLLETQQGSFYRLHRLLAEFVRLQPEVRNLDQEAQMAVEEAMFTRANSLNWAGYPAPLLVLQPHLRAITNAALPREDALAAELCHALGSHLHTIGAYAEASAYYQQALAINRKVLGEEHPHTVVSYNNLASLYYEQGKYEQAEPLCQIVLSIHQKVLGEDHSDTATSYNNLSSLYYEQGKYEQAKPLYQKALSICRKVLGEEHPRTATSYNNLAMLYYKQGKYEQAELLLQQTLGIYQKVLGEEHPEAATSYHNLAALYCEQGKYEQAESLYQKALSIYKKVLGEEHPRTATSYNNLADLYHEQGKYEQAELLYQRALIIRQKVLGEEHPHTATSYNNLADLYHEQGKYEQAEPLFRRALAISIQILGEEHSTTLTIAANYVELLERMGRTP